jgi:hypothetical protein
MGEMLSDSNTLERPFNWKLTPTPRDIKLKGDMLVWGPEGKAVKHSVPQQSDVGMLHWFLRLCWKNTPAEEILKFARKWGTLGLCRHSVPTLHCRCDTDNPNSTPCRDLRLPTGERFELLDTWRDCSRRARAILRIASRLLQNKQGDFEDWRVLSPAIPGSFGKSRNTLIVERSSISDAIRWWWLKYGEVDLQLGWNVGKPSVYFSCNLIGLIGSQLMFAVGRSQGIAICTGCGFPYAPKRRPSPKRGSYCPPCRETAPTRESQARARGKKRESK